MNVVLEKGIFENFGDILEFVGCKIFSRKLLKLKWTHESIRQHGG